MSTLDTMYRAVRFIEQNLREPISVQDVAEAAGYSLYHFSRTFNRVIGHSPYDYIIRRRLSESVNDLGVAGKRIVDIAFEYQFGSPETYARAFRRMFDVLPNRVKKGEAVGRQRFKSLVTLDYIRHINRGDYLKPTFVEREATCLVGIAAWVKGQPDLWGEMWVIFDRVLESLPESPGPGQVYGVSYRLGGREAEEEFYLLGVEVGSLERIPPAMVGKVIPPAKYARFIHKGLARDVGMTLDYIYQTWLPKAGIAVAAPLEVYGYGKQYAGPYCPDSESEVLIPIE